MLNEIISIYGIIDELLKAIGHDEDCRREMNDAEIMTTAICVAMFFNGNHAKACSYLKDHNLITRNLGYVLTNIKTVIKDYASYK